MSTYGKAEKALPNFTTKSYRGKAMRLRKKIAHSEVSHI